MMNAIYKLPVVIILLMFFSFAPQFVKGQSGNNKNVSNSDSVNYVSEQYRKSKVMYEKLIKTNGKSKTHNQIINSTPEEIIKKYGTKLGLELLQEHLVLEMNVERVNRNINVIIINKELSTVAQKYAEYICRYSHYEHTDLNGNDLLKRVENARIDAFYVAENLSMRENIAKVMKGWMYSDGHRENMLKRIIKEVGIGYFGSYWVAMFIF